ncbi:MAG: hypothetical protein GX422_03345 [Deltaproteobacteria bacterium]|nr:hypothetical protein [Deltaproteobacteria bacterium]
MIERRVIFEIHRMADSGLSIRRIAKALHLDRQTVGKYPADPNPARATVVKPGKLDPFKDQIHNRQALNRIRLQEPKLADYDATVLKRRGHHD